MKVKSKVNPKIIILLFAAAAIVVGNTILKTSGIISLFIFLTGIVLIFLGTWKLLYSHKAKKFWLNGFILAGVFIVFLSMWLPSLLFFL
ncbi:hypothetical protein ACFW35_09020 [Fictibacillus sp. NPDC058756]|uniref:hypothetical protein n=1 Tax=Fictibacillus sp. NPDC058756 TaxID=3346625 RepID=UPI0036A3D0E0